jgi:hypothetical protein
VLCDVDGCWKRTRDPVEHALSVKGAPLVTQGRRQVGSAGRSLTQGLLPASTCSSAHLFAHRGARRRDATALRTPSALAFDRGLLDSPFAARLYQCDDSFLGETLEESGTDGGVDVCDGQDFANRSLVVHESEEAKGGRNGVQ